MAQANKKQRIGQNERSCDPGQPRLVRQNQKPPNHEACSEDRAAEFDWQEKFEYGRISAVSRIVPAMNGAAKERRNIPAGGGAQRNCDDDEKCQRRLALILSSAEVPGQSSGAFSVFSGTSTVLRLACRSLGVGST